MEIMNSSERRNAGNGSGQRRPPSGASRGSSGSVKAGRGRASTPSGREGAAYMAERREGAASGRAGGYAGQERGNRSYGSSGGRGSQTQASGYGSGGSRGRGKGASYSGRKVGTASRSASRARGRKKKRAQRIVLLIFLVFFVILAAGGVLGVRRFLRNKARTDLKEQGIASIQAGSYEAAITQLDEALAYSGGKVGEFEKEVLEARAEAEFLQKDYAASLHTWKLLLETDDTSRRYREGAVLCLLETGSLEEALAMEALQSRVYNKMAVEQIQAREYAQALETIERGIQAPEKSALEDLLYNQAAVYGYMGEFAKSLELFEAYEAEYGADEKTQREITFLKSRQGS